MTEPPTGEEQEELDRLHASLHGWALEDVKNAANGGAKLGAFILGAHFIDVLARLSYSRRKENAKAAWDEFVPVYLPEYAGHAEALYRGFRGAMSHNYSADGIRFTDGETNRLRHWTVEDGDRVLHLESFLADLVRAWDTFYENLLTDAQLRARVLDRTRQRPPLAVLGGERVRSSLQIAKGVSLVVEGNNPTHFGATSAAWSETRVVSSKPPPFQFEPPPKTQRVPKPKKRKPR